MKQLRRRTLFVLFFALALLAGTVLLCARYFIHGREWASSGVNQAAYAGGALSSGALYDRNGLLLYDCATKTYADTASMRTATLHLIGDQQGNIATGAKRRFARQLVSYNPITGLSAEGNKVYLSVDATLNQLAYEALDGRKGTVALYDYTTGDVLCMVSSPSYDPTNADQIEAVAEGNSRYEGAYVNRFLSALYTPGSTFKLVTAAAAIETLGREVDSFSFHCTGSYEIRGETVTCPSAHGDLDFAGALANSCNGAFAALALELGGDALEQYAQSAGLLEGVEVSGMTSAAGRFDVASPGSLNLGWSGVGQYHDQVNPASMLTLMGCIARGGSAPTPRLLTRVTSQSGVPAALVSRSESAIGWDKSTCEALKTLMRNNVTEVYGQSRFGELAVCAKSGTAEVGGGLSPHAWFVGFLDEPTHPYAFVVVVENGGGGSSVAGGIAAQLLRAACGEDEK
ncbi:MAG: penicillin-binding protein [Oscillospiraceae bacterium]|nr:penicillin-binding protein [Oscillospiraceae bacterium]